MPAPVEENRRLTRSLYQEQTHPFMLGAKLQAPKMFTTVVERGVDTQADLDYSYVA